MKSILLLSQLVIPQVPSDVSSSHFAAAVIESVSCVESAEENSLGQSLTETTVLVTAKKGQTASACFAQLKADLGEVELISVFPKHNQFVVSVSVPAAPVENDDKVNCLAIGICPQN